MGELNEASKPLDKVLSILQSRDLATLQFEIKYHHQKAMIAERQANYESALEWAEKGLDLINNSAAYNLLNVKLHLVIGDIYTSQGNAKKALDHFARAVDLYNRHCINNKRLLSSIYNSYGTALQNAGDLNQSVKYYRQSLENDREVLPPQHPNLSKTQNNIAISYYYQGDYRRALDYFIDAVNVLAEFYGKEHRQVAAGYNNVGIVYSEIGDLEKATDFLEKSLDIKESVFGINHPDVAIGYQNLGAIYFDMESYERAIKYYKQAEKRHLEQFPEGHSELANVYANLGEAYAAGEEFKKALKYYQKDLEINLPTGHPFIGDTYRKIGDAYARLENHEMALDHYQKALEVFTGDFSLENRYENPPFEQITYPYLLLEALSAKGEELLSYGKESSSQELLERSLQIHLEAAELVENLQLSYSREESKFLLRERTVDVYKQGFETAYLLQEQYDDPRYKEYAFYFAEKSRNQILLEQVRRINARNLAEIPDSLTDQEQLLHKQINRLQNELSGLAETPQVKDSLQQSFRDSLFHLRKNLDKYIRYLESSYPKYHALKYAPVVTSAEEIQQEILADNQVMLSYFFGDESLFALIISKNSLEVRDLETDSLLQQDVREYRNTILESNSPDEFAEKSHRLYKKLIDPIADLIAGKNLLIIPKYWAPFVLIGKSS